MYVCVSMKSVSPFPYSEKKKTKYIRKKNVEQAWHGM